MLAREQGRRHQHCGLEAVLHRFEDGPDGDLGLAEADIAADEAVHRSGVFHVRLDVGDRLQLVVRLWIGEGLLQLGLPGRVRGEGVPRRRRPALVELNELAGDLPGGRADARLLLLPVRAAEAVERRLLAAGVRGDRVYLVGRDVELVAAAILEQQVIPLCSADRPFDEAAVAGDAVHVVNDERSRREIVEEALRRPAPRPRHPVRPAAPGDVGLGENCQLRAREDGALVELGDRDVNARAPEQPR